MNLPPSPNYFFDPIFEHGTFDETEWPIPDIPPPDNNFSFIPPPSPSGFPNLLPSPILDIVPERAPPVAADSSEEKFPFIRIFGASKSATSSCFVMWDGGEIHTEYSPSRDIRTSRAFLKSLKEKREKRIFNDDPWRTPDWRQVDRIIAIYCWKYVGRSRPNIINARVRCAHQSGNLSDIPLVELPNEWKEKIRLGEFTRADYLPDILDKDSNSGISNLMTPNRFCSECFRTFSNRAETIRHKACSLENSVCFLPIK